MDSSLRLLHAQSAVQRIWAAHQGCDEPEFIHLGLGASLVGGAAAQ